MPSDYIKPIEKRFDNGQLIPEVIRMLDEGHTVTLRLRGYSMRPFLENDRDKALLAKAKTPQKGDVVLAEVSEGHYVLHRIIRIDGDDITLRGDGNLGKEHCAKDDIKGFAIGFYRKESIKLDKTNGAKWRIYSCLWTNAYPIRRYLLAAYRLMRYLKNKKRTAIK